jgi:PAS domain S-box-containing protein
MPDPSPRDQLPGRPSALEMENAKLRKALAILSNIQTNAAAALVGLREDFGTGSNHDGPLNDANELEFAREETRMGQVDLRMSEAALASSRAETKVGQADLLASEVALAASQVETKIGLADLLASAVELAASRAEAKISVRDLLASAVALSLSRAETIEATNDLRDREGQITSITKDQELLRNVVEASPTALILVGAAGLIAMINAKAERMFGYSRAELHGKKLEVLLPEKFRGGHVKLRTDFLVHMSSRAMGEGRELFGLRKDRTQFPLEIGLNPIDLGGEIMVLAGVTDITTRLAAEEATLKRRQLLERSNGELIRARLRAEQATRAKSRFLAGMSHELRTPLNGILGYAQLLDIEGGLTALQADRVTSMRSAGQHLLEMITSVLDLSEVEAGQITLQPSLINLRHLARECLNVLQPSADSRGLTLRLNVADEVPREIVADGTRLRQVLLNLLANAVKFTDKGEVGLCFSLGGEACADARLLVQIVDTGRGIPQEHRASLFQDFERLGANSAGAVEGAGLGLAISAHLIGLMGAHIVHADNPRGGSVFSFKLPLHTAATPGTRKVSSPRSLQAEIRPDAPCALAPGLSVLVVDDIAMNRDIAASFLGAAGHAVVCVDNGTAAVTVAAQNDFDFILMDLRMPEMDGFEAARRIRAIGGERGRVPIIALTAHAFADHIEECRRVVSPGVV